MKFAVVKTKAKLQFKRESNNQKAREQVQAIRANKKMRIECFQKPIFLVLLLQNIGNIAGNDAVNNEALIEDCKENATLGCKEILSLKLMVDYTECWELQFSVCYLPSREIVTEDTIKDYIHYSNILSINILLNIVGISITSVRAPTINCEKIP